MQDPQSTGQSVCKSVANATATGPSSSVAKQDGRKAGRHDVSSTLSLHIGTVVVDVAVAVMVVSVAVVLVSVTVVVEVIMTHVPQSTGHFVLKYDPDTKFWHLTSAPLRVANPPTSSAPTSEPVSGSLKSVLQKFGSGSPLQTGVVVVVVPVPVVVVLVPVVVVQPENSWYVSKSLFSSKSLSSTLLRSKHFLSLIISEDR